MFGRGVGAFFPRGKLREGGSKGKEDKKGAWVNLVKKKKNGFLGYCNTARCGFDGKKT